MARKHIIRTCNPFAFVLFFAAVILLVGIPESSYGGCQWYGSPNHQTWTPSMDQYMIVGTICIGDPAAKEQIEIENFTDDITMTNVRLVWPYHYTSQDPASVFKAYGALGDTCPPGSLGEYEAIAHGPIDPLPAITIESVDCSQMNHVTQVNIAPDSTVNIPYGPNFAWEQVENVPYRRTVYHCDGTEESTDYIRPGTVAACVNYDWYFSISGDNIVADAFAPWLCVNECTHWDAGHMYDLWSHEIPLDITLSSDRETVTSGETVTLTIRYANKGNAAFHDVVIHGGRISRVSSTFDPDESPPLVTGEIIDAGSGTVTEYGTLFWKIGTLPGGTGGEIVFKVKINGDTVSTKKWPFNHTSFIVGHQSDPRARAKKTAVSGFHFTKGLYAEIKPLLEEAKTGEGIDYTIEYRNLTDRSFDDVVFLVPIPQFTTYVQGSATDVNGIPPIFNAALNRLEWHLGDVKLYTSGRVAFQVRVDQCIPLEVNGITGRVELWTSDNYLGEDTCTTPLKKIDLTLDVQEKSANAGDILHYTIRVKNLMDCPQTFEDPGITLTLPVPDMDLGVTLVSADQGGAFIGTAVEWTIPSLTDQELVFHAHFRVPDPVPDNLMVIRNQAYMMIPPWGKFQNSNYVKTIIGQYVIWGWIKDVEPYFLTKKDKEGNPVPPRPDRIFYKFKDNAPLTGAIVELWKNGVLVGSTTSDDDITGNYHLSVSEPGAYRIKVKTDTAIGEFIYEKDVVFEESTFSKSINIDFTFPVTLIYLENYLIKEMQEIDVLIKSMLKLISHRDNPEVNNLVNLVLQGKFYFKYNMDKAQAYLNHLKSYNEANHPEDIDTMQKENLARLVGAHTFLYHQAVDAAAMSDDLAKNVSLLIAMYTASNSSKTAIKWLDQFVGDKFPQWKALMSSKNGTPPVKLEGMDATFKAGGKEILKELRIGSFVLSNEIYKLLFQEPPLQDVEAREQYFAWKDTLFFALRFLSAPFVNRLIGDVDFELAFLITRSAMDYILMSMYIDVTQWDVDVAVDRAFNEEYPEGTYENALTELNALDTELRSVSQSVHSTVRTWSTYVSYSRAVEGGITIWKTPPQQMPYFKDKLSALIKGLAGSKDLKGISDGSLYFLAAQLGVQGTLGVFSFGQFLHLTTSGATGVDIVLPLNSGGRLNVNSSKISIHSLKQSTLAGIIPEVEDYSNVLANVMNGLSVDPFDTAKNVLPSLLNAEETLSNAFDAIYNKVIASPPGLIENSQLLDIQMAYLDSSSERGVLHSLILAYLLDPAEGNFNEIMEQATLVRAANQLASDRLSEAKPLVIGITTEPFIVLTSLDVPRVVCPDVPVIITATIKNIGDTQAEKIQAELFVNEKIILLSPASQNIGTIGPHATETVSWQIRKTDLDSSSLQVFAQGPGVASIEETDWIIAENSDVDNDGMSNCWEIANSLNPHDDSDADADPDTDNLTNLDEYKHNTNPQNPDSDGDNIPDGTEIALGLDPLVPNANVLENVNDLTAFRTSSSSVSLTLTAPGYSGLGRANNYDLRYATTLITEANWASATRAYGEQTPLAVGTLESITVRGLEGNTLYYFAMKGLDYEGKATPLSNVVTAKTAGIPDWTRQPDPVLTPGGSVAFDNNGVYHPTVIYDTTDPAYPGGVYKMWYSGSSPGGQYGDEFRIGYAISHDGIAWVKVPGPETGGSVIDISEVAGFTEVQLITPSVVKDEAANPDERYRLWYYQTGIGIPYSNGIIYCTSPDGIHWTKVGKVFGSSAMEGRFDQISAYFPSVVLDATEPDPSARYKMWYTGIAANGKYGIGYATSPDGMNWTRVDGPREDKSVLTSGIAGSFDEARVWTPSVRKIGETYVMFYTGVGPRSFTPAGTGAGGQVRTIGFAVSKDGVNWDKVTSSGPGGCSLDVGPAGHFDEEGVRAPTIVWNGTTLKMWYGASVPDGTRLIGHATASAGLNSLLTLKSVRKRDIGSEGGTVSIIDPESPVSGAAVIIPPGVLDTLTTITIGEFTGELPPMPNVKGIGLPIHFGPEGIDFSPHLVTIVLPYTAAALAEAEIDDPNLLDVYTFNPVSRQWVLVSGAKTVDAINNLIMIEVSHFSIFQLGIAQNNTVIEVPVDIHPRACPNMIKIKSKGMLPVAILGTKTLDISLIDPSTILMENVAPERYAKEDVATPFSPFTGKVKSTDCTTAGRDGFMDLMLKFDMKKLTAALGNVNKGDIKILRLSGKLKDGTPFIGEDVVVIVNN